MKNPCSIEKPTTTLLASATLLTGAGLAPAVTALPGTGGAPSLVPVFAGMGLAVPLAAAWFVRRRLAD